MNKNNTAVIELLSNGDRTEKDWIELCQSLQDELEDTRRQLDSECNASMKLWNDLMDLRTQIAIHSHLTNVKND